MSPRRTGCRCGHSITLHQHYGRGEYCSATTCGCKRYRRHHWWQR